MVQPLWEMLLQFLVKLNAQLPYDLTAALLGMYPREMKTVHTKYVSTVTCVGVFIAAFFVITANWEQPRCSSTVSG